MFAREGGGKIVAILRIMASTSFLSSSERVVEYFLMSARKRISSSESSPSILRVSRSPGVSLPGKKSAREISIALGKSAIGAVRFDHFPDVNLWFLFGHGIFPLTRAYLTSNPQIGARDISTIVPHQNIPAVKRAPEEFGCTIPLTTTPQVKIPHALARTPTKLLRMSPAARSWTARRVSAAPLPSCAYRRVCSRTKRYRRVSKAPEAFRRRHNLSSRANIAGASFRHRIRTRGLLAGPERASLLPRGIPAAAP